MGASSGPPAYGLDARWGDADGLFTLDNWSLRPTENVWSAGPGPAAPCAGAWTAVDENRSGSPTAGFRLAAVSLLPIHTPSDANEPNHLLLPVTVLPYPPRIYDSVGFSDSFVAGGTPPIEHCGGVGTTQTLPWGSTLIAVVVAFPLGGGTIVVDVDLPSVVSYQYVIPANATGVWSIDATSAPGLAFSWSPCP